MLKKSNTLLLVSTLSTLLAACSSGSNCSTPTTSGFQGGNYGPIAPQMYDNIFATKPIIVNSQSSKQLNGAGGAADVAAATGTIAAIFPPAGVVLGPISAIAGLVAADQVAAQINQINSQLNYQETQIQGIYGILNNTYNQVYNLTTSTAKQSLASSYNNWYSNIFAPSLFYGYGTSTSTIRGLNGQSVTNPWYQEYINILMVSNPNLNNITTPSTGIVTLLTNVAVESSSMADLNSMSQNNANKFLNVLNSASLSSTSTNSLNTAVSINAIPSNISNTSNYTIQLLLAAQTALQVALPQAGTTTNTSNYINLVESYNQFVNSVYLSNLSVLQTLYTTEATNNYLNYLNYTASMNPAANTPLSQICPLEANGSGPTNFFNTINFYAGSAVNCGGQSPNVYYPTGYNVNNYQQISAANAESAFIYAQQQLTNLYARRVNVLYQQTTSYIYSDLAYPNQGVNLINGESTLSKEMQQVLGSTNPVKTISNPVENYSFVSGNWTDWVNVYQYPITNIDYMLQIESQINSQIATNPESFPTIPAINSTNYPTAFQNIQSGYYDGESLAVYSNNVSVNSIFNFGQDCVVNSGLYFWQYGNTLSCDIWSIANNYSVNYNTNNNSFNFQISGGVIPTPGWLPSQSGNSLLAGGSFSVATSAQNYHIYLDSNSIVAPSAYQLINGNGHYSLTNNSLYDGGFYNSSSSYHTAGVQVTLPDGFNLPFYIVGIGGNGDAIMTVNLQLVCPAANNTATSSTSSYQTMLNPYITACSASGSNASAGNSTLSITDISGNSYSITLNGGGGPSMHQNAYLSVSAN